MSFVNVTININHPSTQDLIVSITSPQGIEVLLTSNNGDDGDNYVNTTFSQDAQNTVSEASAPFTGTYLPEGDLSVFNNQNSLGDWVLTVINMSAQTVGEFENFSLELCGVETLSLNDLYFETSIWSNPSNGILNVSFDSVSSETKIIIFDLKGRLMNSFEFKQHESQFKTKLDLRTLNKSVYIL
ncbi:proprotein convertase P-domain-containing protein [Winogradskyella sp. 4-2091]|uniref:proprotein convertase P-domain-containing protein n=1 Tax=Winogradskyella sp. 4-2091 TaxID=3381659 RepID=UPI003892AFBB